MKDKWNLCIYAEHRLAYEPDRRLSVANDIANGVHHHEEAGVIESLSI
jgi:hypothetical protein